MLPLIAVERPDPAGKWLKDKLREKEKKEKWSKKRRRRKKKKRKGRKHGRKRRMWEEEAIGFAGNSTATAAFPFKSLTTTNIELRFRSWKPDGILLESRGGAGDFLILSLVSGKLQLRWELGSGPGMLVVGETGREGRHNNGGDNRGTKGGEMGGMGLGRWHKVKVKRYHRDVQLTVDRQLVVIGRSKGSHKSLNVEPVMRLGSTLFGCIGGLKVDGRQIDVEGGRQRCRGCKSCKASLTSSRPSTSSMRKNSWPSFMLNNNV